MIFHILIAVALTVAALPLYGAYSATQPPTINLLAINGQSAPTIYADEGQVSYSLIVESFSKNQKALVTLTVKNTETQEVTTVFENQWLETKTNTGTMELQKGTYVVTLTASDEEGRAAEPYSVTVIVGADTDFLISKVEPNPVLIKKAQESKEIAVTLANLSPSPKATTVGWRWKGESTLQSEMNVTLPGRYENNGQSTITFPIVIDMKGQMTRDIEIVLNPNHDPVEKTYDNNVIVVPVQYDWPDLRLNGPRLVSFTDDKMTIDFPVEQVALPGRTITLLTKLEYGHGEGTNKIGEITNISLAVGEQKDITVTLPRHEVAYGHINPKRDAPSQENYWENNYKAIALDFTKTLNLYVKSITGGTYRQGEKITTVVTVGSIPDTVMNDSVDLVLRFNGKEVGRQQVHINPGEERFIPFTWTAPVTGAIKPTEYVLEAEINPTPRKLEEITYDDNIARTRVILLPEDIQGSTCDRNQEVTSAISGKYEYYCNCTPIGCSICVGNYYESAVLKQKGPDPATVKAGMGFAATFETEYFNDNPHNGSKHDFTNLTGVFDDEKKILPDVKLVPKYEPINRSNNTWAFPRARIKRGQGDIEMIEYLPTLEELSIDPDQFVDGGNKYYTSFYQKDGTYNYAVTAQGAGVEQITYTDITGKTWVTNTVQPRLKSCVDNSYNVEGSPHDDYIIRRVDPNIPFPQNGSRGWDWREHEYIFRALSPWWNTYGEESPNGLPEQEWKMELD
ncbi:hypothetical protein QO009_003065 [Brevibacillus aydinogluensis]|jgi:hypothetical protein|uniref:hypothetical protein n=1 Tax=Brevibacillus aydinogluensis TaxID=927786 RepID=UPI002892F685|nr:hypothetical protein [Brevibacillus aydinogluensis]MDT3417170.1 hypothetical protein [Brevibacillus aydinogluensis]